MCHCNRKAFCVVIYDSASSFSLLSLILAVLFWRYAKLMAFRVSAVAFEASEYISCLSRQVIWQSRTNSILTRFIRSQRKIEAFGFSILQNCRKYQNLTRIQFITRFLRIHWIVLLSRFFSLVFVSPWRPTTLWQLQCCLPSNRKGECGEVREKHLPLKDPRDQNLPWVFL